jgi:hypothetical protein
MLTFVDAGVLILGARGTAELSERALAILEDPRRTFVASAFLKLELIPKPSYFQRAAEVAFYATFFAAVSLWIPAERATSPLFRVLGLTVSTIMPPTPPTAR